MVAIILMYIPASRTKHVPHTIKTAGTTKVTRVGILLTIICFYSSFYCGCDCNAITIQSIL